jgi:hypothetical protein
MTTPEERKARWMAEGMTESQAALLGGFFQKKRPMNLCLAGTNA